MGCRSSMGKIIGRRLRWVLVACTVWLSPLPAWSGTVAWDILTSGTVEPFDDPFKALTQSQLYALGTLARLLEQGADSGNGTSAGRELSELYEQFAEEGVDPDYLLSRREEIKQKRRNASLRINPDAINQDVEIVGYPVPATISGGETSKFYLVPQPGLCAHVALPAPNQIILVETGGPLPDLNFRKPMRVSGRLDGERSRKGVYLIDGPAMVESAYTITNADAVPFGSADLSPARLSPEQKQAYAEKLRGRYGSLLKKKSDQ